MLNRSIEAFKKIVGTNELKAFISGDGVNIEGHYFQYRLRKNSQVDLLDNAYNPRGIHIPYELAILDHQSGLELANLCVLFDNTPAVDQAAALIMHIQSGEESAILNKANLFNVQSDFYRVIEGLDLSDLDDTAHIRQAQERATRPEKETLTGHGHTDQSRDYLSVMRDTVVHRMQEQHATPLRQAIEAHIRQHIGLEPWFLALSQPTTGVNAAPPDAVFEHLTRGENGSRVLREVIEAEHLDLHLPIASSLSYSRQGERVANELARHDEELSPGL